MNQYGYTRIKVVCGHNNRPNGGGGLCKSCYDKKYHIKNKAKKNRISLLWGRVKRPYLKPYGLTPKDYDRLFELQNGRCGICERHRNEFKKNLSVDHCHITGKVRGLLCTSCNAAIGSLGDSTIVIKKALAYLEKHATI